MRQPLRAGVIALALLSGIGLTAAQTGSTQSTLTPQQQQSVHQGLASQPSDTAPSNFQGQVGDKMPNSMTPHAMPNKVATDVPGTKNLLFIKLPDRVLLIDPDSKAIAEILLASDTTGSVPSQKK